MTKINHIQKRFDELSDMARQIEKSQQIVKTNVPYLEGWSGPGGRTTHEVVEHQIDFSLFLEWQASVLSLLDRIFPPEHTTAQRFDEVCRSKGTAHSAFRGAKAYFQSARSDFEGGYLFDVRNLVHASIFSDELAQAEHFLEEGYKVSAAVIAGVALETTLRELCEQHPDLEPAKADKMISDLAKENAVNKMRADQLRSWMKIRNSAAHGKPDEFDENDVTRMIDGVRDFIAIHMS